MATPVIQWTEGGVARKARWRSESGLPPPDRVEIADDRMTADAAYALATQGVALLWRGDFHQARQMLVALASRADRHPRKKKGAAPRPTTFPDAFHAHRQAQAQRARTLSRLLVPFDRDYSIPLGRAPDVRKACIDAYGPGDAPSVASMRDLQGMIGAYEWRTNGIEIPEAGGSIHPHYGIFAPVRREYIGLVAAAPLPAGCEVAFDVGTGTGVLAAVLAKRGVPRVIATDLDPRAIACARDNAARLGFGARIEVVEANLFPDARANLVVCNPPWIPARPSSPIEQGIYDFESAMLRGFLGGLAEHLQPGGEGWLILSDLAEHLKLRSRDELMAMFEAAGLQVVDRMDTRPKHPKASDSKDPLHIARAAEVTSLWRLAARN